MDNIYLRWVDIPLPGETVAVGVGERGYNYHVVEKVSPEDGSATYDVILERDDGTYRGYLDGAPGDGQTCRGAKGSIESAKNLCQQDYEQMRLKKDIYWFQGCNAPHLVAKDERVPYLFADAWGYNGQFFIYKDENPVGGNFQGSAENCYQVSHISEDGRVVHFDSQMYGTLKEAIALCNQENDSLQKKFYENQRRDPGRA